MKPLTPLHENVEISITVNEQDYVEITNKRSGVTLVIVVAGNALVGRVKKPRAATLSTDGPMFVADLPFQDGTIETPPYAGNDGRPVSVLRAEGYDV